VIKGALERFRQGLRKTRESLFSQLRTLLRGKVRLDPETLERIEELLISADMGVQSSLRITRDIEQRLREEGGEANLESVLEVIRSDVREILTTARPKVRPPAWGEGESEGPATAAKAKKQSKQKKQKKQKEQKKGKRVREGKGADVRAEPPAAPAETAGSQEAAAGIHVLFIVGVNGTGKTTSIAKLAALFKARGRSVLLAAADTFRAAAVEQLEVWAERVGVPCIHQAAGADPAAVVYDALAAAEARGHDVVIVDTAGRLHTKTNLMAELGKMERVIEKKTGRPPETLLVVDANTGQNGLAQAKVFAETIPVEGLILTKLDGTAKGGIVVAIAETMGLPVRYVGIGETAEDLAEFDADVFVEALFAEWQADEAG
jgi:fused signal recognition particle receptor